MEAVCAPDHWHTTSVAERDGPSTDSTWTGGGKRRHRGEPHEALNGTLDREKGANRVIPASGTDGTR